jgi:tetratricopeptide (TPR) repeat protein
MGKYEESLPWAEKTVEVSPEDPDVIDSLATVYQDLGRYDEALEKFWLFLKLYKEQDDPEEIQETKSKIAELKELMK